MAGVRRGTRLASGSDRVCARPHLLPCGGGVGGAEDSGKTLMEHETFTWLGRLPFPEPILTSGLVALLLVAFAAAVHRRLAATEAAIDPDDGVTARNIAEMFVEAISGLAEGVIGHHSVRYVPL